MERTEQIQAVFVGGPAMQALARFARMHINTRLATHLMPLRTPSGARVWPDGTAIVVMEVDDRFDPVPKAELPVGARVLRFPALTADFLWPFAGQPHPLNRGRFSLRGGPYPGELGDRYLDRLKSEWLDDEEVVRRYLALDLGETGLDRRLEARLATLRRLDKQCGTSMADVVEPGFRTEWLFATRNRPAPALLRHYAMRLSQFLGLGTPEEKSLAQIDAPRVYAPLHPSVIRHFELPYVTPETTYPINDEGRFTFEEHCRRYLSFTWNERLHRGLRQAASDPAAALADLEAGLAISPGSERGRQALAEVRRALGMPPLPDPEPDRREAAQTEPEPEFEEAEDEALPAPPLPEGAAPLGSVVDRRPPELIAPPPAPDHDHMLEEALRDALPPMRAAPATEALPEAATAELRPQLPFEVPPERPPAPPKKKTGLFGRLLSRD